MIKSSTIRTSAPTFRMMPFTAAFTKSLCLPIFRFSADSTDVIFEKHLFLSKLILVLVSFYLSINSFEEFFDFLAVYSMALLHKFVIFLRVMPRTVNFDELLSCSFDVNHIESFSSCALWMIRFPTILCCTWYCAPD